MNNQSTNSGEREVVANQSDDVDVCTSCEKSFKFGAFNGNIVLCKACLDKELEFLRISQGFICHEVMSQKEFNKRFAPNKIIPIPPSKPYQFWS